MEKISYIYWYSRLNIIDTEVGVDCDSFGNVATNRGKKYLIVSTSVGTCQLYPRMCSQNVSLTSKLIISMNQLSVILLLNYTN